MGFQVYWVCGLLVFGVVGVLSFWVSGFAVLMLFGFYCDYFFSDFRLLVGFRSLLLVGLSLTADFSSWIVG